VIGASSGFSTREREVLDHVLLGNANDAIALHLGIARATVSNISNTRTGSSASRTGRPRPRCSNRPDSQRRAGGSVPSGRREAQPV
jgi:FixJ family two-component response regulator